MERPDTGIYGITIEHLNNLRNKFDCSYSEILLSMYGLDTINHKLVNLLVWSLTNDGYLPPKEKVIEYQAQFEKENAMLDLLREMMNDKLKDK